MMGREDRLIYTKENNKSMSKQPQSDSAAEHASRVQFNLQMCDFIDRSPTPFHAVKNMAELLDQAKFIGLQERDSWTLDAGGKYYVIRNQSSIIAWTQGQARVTEQGFHMLGAHTDSPCLKVKPNADIHQSNSWRLGVEVYGGALLNPWFDRDLSLAGRIHYQTEQGELNFSLIDFKCPIATIPSLAIHLDRDANQKRSINAQVHLPVLLACGDDNENNSLHRLLLTQLHDAGIDASKILDHELFFYDTQPSNTLGIHGDFIAASRLDNLLSCYVNLMAIIAASEEVEQQWSLLICSDHEEVGSNSAAGAAGPFLQQTLQRMLPDTEDFARAMSRSTLVSTDNAHALHPSHTDKMDPLHSPLINAGPVIKINANQRYASNSETQAIFRTLCDRCNIPVQNFVTRSDMGCGSTIGPITATEIGVKTLDVGIPTYGMHSIRELTGSHDPIRMKKVLTYFLCRH